MALKLTTAAADAMLTALATSLNSGTIIIYSGTEPATADTALSSNTVLAELTFAATAFNTTTSTSGGTSGLTTSGSDRVMTAFPIANDTSANADGTATFFRAFITGTTNQAAVRYQGTVGTTGQQLNLTNTGIVSTGVVSISSLTITMPLA